MFYYCHDMKSCTMQVAPGRSALSQGFCCLGNGYTKVLMKMLAIFAVLVYGFGLEHSFFQASLLCIERCYKVPRVQSCLARGVWHMQLEADVGASYPTKEGAVPVSPCSPQSGLQ